MCELFSCASWTRLKTSPKYLAISIYIEALIAVSFAFIAFGNLDESRHCYGQTLKSFKNLQVIEYKRVTLFTIKGAQNIDIYGMFHLWFVSGFTLTISAIILQLFTVYLLKKRMERNHWLFKLYIILDSVIILVVLSWLCFGAYWRLNDHGKLCTANYLKEHGEAMLLFYQSGAIILAMCLFWFIMGLCAGYWSYYASLPIRRFNRSSVFCCLCDQ